MLRTLKKLVCACLCGAVLLVPMGGLAVQAEAELDASMMLHQEGNQLYNAKGQAVRLLGTNVPQLTWSPTGDGIVDQILDLALNEWESNFIRLGVVPRFWLYGAYETTTDADGNTVAVLENGKPKQTVTAEQYRAKVDELIDKIVAQGKYVLLNNHSFFLPDEDSFKFWESAAAKYKDHPNIIFGLFNEPTQCTWDMWKDGGHIVYDGLTDWGESTKVDITSRGLQALLDTVRATGAKNVITVSGLTWGFDLTNVTTTHRLDQGDGNGLIYETHPYPDRDPDWDTCIGIAAQEYPILVGEAGPKKESMKDANDKDYMERLLAFFEKYQVNLTAWALGAWPNLLAQPKLEPTAYGQLIKDYIHENQANRQVTFYEEQDLVGKSLSIDPGKYTAADFQARDFDLAKLASVDSKYNSYQYVMTLYENSEFGGKSYQVISSSKNVTSERIGFAPQSVLIERSTPKNILQGNATATVPGNEQDAGKLTDGTNAKWEFTSESGEPQSIVLKLNNPYLLTNIVVSHAGAANELPVFNTQNFDVSVSDNGVVYTRLADYRDNSLNETEIRFEQTVTQFIKITVRAGGKLDPKRICISEIKAYGVPYEGAVGELPSQMSSPDAGGVSVWFVLLCVADGLLVVGAGALAWYLFYYRKRKNRAK